MGQGDTSARNVDKVKNFFDFLLFTDADLIEPATEEALALCEEALEKAGEGKLPGDYARFLREWTNGFAWNGFVFYGTSPVRPRWTDKELPDLAGANAQWHAGNRDAEKYLLLGSFQNGNVAEFYCYHKERKGYLCVGGCLEQRKEYERIDDLLAERVKRLYLVAPYGLPEDYPLFGDLFVDRIREHMADSMDENVNEGWD